MASVPDDADNDCTTTLQTTSKTPQYLAFSNQKIISKADYSQGCDLRIHVHTNRTIRIESDKYLNHFISVATNGQLYPEQQLHSSSNVSQSFHCYVKGCFRNNGIVMLCTTPFQTLCIDRDPTSINGIGGRNKLAHFRVHKVANGNIRMFESVIFPGQYLQIKKGMCNCMVKLFDIYSMKISFFFSKSRVLVINFVNFEFDVGESRILSFWNRSENECTLHLLRLVKLSWNLRP